MIPDAAVEAAAKRMASNEGGMFSWKLYEEDARMILAAAAPHMLAEAWEEGGRAATGTHDTGYPSRNPYRTAP